MSNLAPPLHNKSGYTSYVRQDWLRATGAAPQIREVHRRRRAAGTSVEATPRGGRRARMAHHAGNAAAIIFAFVAYVIAIFFNTLSSLPAGYELGILKNQTSYIADTYFTDITPSGWTFGVIWSVIYILQALILLYGLSTICLRWTKTQGYLYNSPAVIPASFYATYVLNMIANTAWVFLFDRSELTASAAVLPIIPITLYACNIVSYRALSRVGGQLVAEGLTKHVWIIRILVHNGIAFYATWTTIATYLNIAIALKYDAGLSMEAVCWIALVLLNATVAIWFVLETFIWDKHLRYTFAPYIVLLVALSGSLAKNYDMTAPKSYSVYTAALLGLSALLGLVKAFVMVWRHVRHPITHSRDFSGAGNKADIPM